MEEKTTLFPTLVLTKSGSTGPRALFLTHGLSPNKRLPDKNYSIVGRATIEGKYKNILLKRDVDFRDKTYFASLASGSLFFQTQTKAYRLDRVRGSVIQRK